MDASWNSGVPAGRPAYVCTCHPHHLEVGGFDTGCPQHDCCVPPQAQEWARPIAPVSPPVRVPRHRLVGVRALLRSLRS
jgi:hypothetical protein